MSGVSQHSVQNRYRAPVTPLLSQTTPLNRNSNSTPKVTFNTSVSTQKGLVTNTTSGNVVKNQTALLSRKVLPQTVKWVGNQEGSFEYTVREERISTIGNTIVSSRVAIHLVK